MEQKQSSYGGSVCHQLPPLSAKYPWFVSQNTGSDEDSSRDQYFYTLHDPFTKYQCQIPELLGRRIRGYYHGWVILSDRLQNVTWSLLNPVTSQMIHFPPLILKDGNSESIRECCLSAPPDDPSSILLLTRTNKPSFVFFRLNGKRKNLRWIEMSYASQLKRITGVDGDFIHNLTWCNGKIYAVSCEGSFARFIIQLDILVKDKEVLIKFLLLGSGPCTSWGAHPEKLTYTNFLKGYCNELFYIEVGFSEKRLDAVYLFKLDVTSIKSEDMEKFKGLDMSSNSWHDLEDFNDILGTTQLWEQLFDLKDAIFFVDLARDNLTCYRPGIASELGGYIHIRDRMDNILYSYHVKENTISPSLVLPTSNVSVWECRFEDDLGGAKCTLDSKQEKNEIVVRSVTDNGIGLDEWNLLTLPFDILKLIMEHCAVVEYLSFRATCKLCEVAAPLVQQSKKTSLTRLQTYSSVSPWLMVVDNNQGMITFTDPMLGDNYFMKNLHVSIPHQEILCSRFGWLFFFSFDIQRLVLYNPFTRDLRKLPVTGYGFNTACFSAPPTSPDCMVAGFSIENECFILIHHVARESSWRAIRVSAQPDSIRLPTFFGQDLYALDGDGKLIGFKESGEENYSSTFVEATVPISSSTSPSRYYLMKCGHGILKVIVGKFGERVEVLTWEVSKQEWEKVDSLGNHMIYICDTTCLCIEAKTREMENKIYFPILHSKNKKIVYYSLKTCTGISLYTLFTQSNKPSHTKNTHTSMAETTKYTPIPITTTNQTNPTPDFNLTKTLFQFRTKKTRAFAYVFILVFVAVTAFLAFNPSPNPSSPWFSNIFSVTTNPHSNSTNSVNSVNSVRSQFNSIYSYFFAANSTNSVHKFTFDGFNRTVKRNESTIGAKIGVGDSGLKAGLNSVNKGYENKLIDVKDLVKCDLFDGEWVKDESYPLYKPGSCSLIDEQFNCYVNGRPDKGFQMLRWKPKACSLPRLDGSNMLQMLRGKRLVFVGDSLNRNMWESLICILRNSVKDQLNVYEASGRHHFRSEPSYSFVFKDYNCTVEFFVAPFIVRESETKDKNGTKKETLRLDLIGTSADQYKNADIVVFNTGHWWTHDKTAKGKDYYQEGSHVYSELNVLEAFRKAMTTWGRWVDANINPSKTSVFFRGYSASHFRGGQWNSGGQCDNEVEPIKNTTYLSPYPDKMKTLERVLRGMKTQVTYLNITRLTDFRKDGHPSIYRKQHYSEEERKSPLHFQDCSHWCLPGVPDSWNEILYAELLVKQYQNQQQKH